MCRFRPVTISVAVLMLTLGSVYLVERTEAGCNVQCLAVTCAVVYTGPPGPTTVYYTYSSSACFSALANFYSTTGNGTCATTGPTITRKIAMSATGDCTETGDYSTSATSCKGPYTSPNMVTGPLCQGSGG